MKLVNLGILLVFLGPINLTEFMSDVVWIISNPGGISLAEGYYFWLGNLSWLFTRGVYASIMGLVIESIWSRNTHFREYSK